MTNRTQVTVGVDVSLRDLIAAAISGVDDWRGVTDPSILADAVIAELSLRQETRDGYTLENGAGEVIRRKKPQHRYVTKWESDDES
jgi:hypothetical protein